METYAELKDFVDNPGFENQRRVALHKLDMAVIDAPIVEIIEGFSRLPYCYTLQSCFGHFVYEGQKNRNSTDPLPVSNSTVSVEYRIAYIALCIENSEAGRTLFNDLSQIPAIDPAYVQFCCAEWFWERPFNSYALQVEPDRFKTQDTAFVDYQEALHIEKVRNRFFGELKGLIEKRLS